MIKIFHWIIDNLQYHITMNLSWRVVYYIAPGGEIPVKDFLDEADVRIKIKVLRILMHCEEYGLQSIIPHIKKLTGTPLWEIRILGADNIRVLFVTQVEKQIFLLHAFNKKSQKTPAREINLAISRLREYQKRKIG